MDMLQIPGLNVAAGLAHFEGNRESYLLVLRTFATHAPGHIKIAKTFLETGNEDKELDLYRIAVHSLKGTCAGIGAGHLGDMAEALEGAARRKDMAFIKANNSALVEAAEKLIAGLDSFLQAPPEEPIR
ncbi:MAG: Hpt domain-containing protein [Treponema sp.]|jgi:HPt (histidine-containing phosphotransfer) domain-containing protein|nr:Hpt domain-containing protein [Treponema sp.]